MKEELNAGEYARRMAWDSSTPGEEYECTSSASSRGSSPIHHQKLIDIDEPERVKPEDVKTSSEMDMMKERFAKLLLGEDMSGGGKGVCTALAISNAITNLSASIFGELWKLEPISKERRLMWQREMGWFLSVSDYIVEFVPSLQTSPDGATVEVMITRPRSDLHMNLPALRKLDTMLLESLNGFRDAEFRYQDRKNSIMQEDDAVSRQGGKWWLPSPKVPPDGLSENARKHLQNQKECLSQILKASLAINGQVLSEMEVPSAYWEDLPKGQNVKSLLGDSVYRAITAEQYSPEAIMDTLDKSTEYKILEFVNKLEAGMHIWKRQSKEARLTNGRGSSWGNISIGQIEKWELCADRSETLLIMLHHRYPGLPQTSLDTTKIQFNKDVGQAILEGYSRVLESLAYNVISRIDDVIHVDEVTKCAQQALGLSRSTSVSSTSASPFHNSQPPTSVKQSSLAKSSSTHSGWLSSPRKGSLSHLNWPSEKGMEPDFDLIPDISANHQASGIVTGGGGHKSWASMGNMNLLHSPPSRD